jgi:hypothetical protein
MYEKQALSSCFGLLYILNTVFQVPVVVHSCRNKLHLLHGFEILSSHIFQSGQFPSQIYKVANSLCFTYNIAKIVTLYISYVFNATFYDQGGCMKHRAILKRCTEAVGITLNI